MSTKRIGSLSQPPALSVRRHFLCGRRSGTVHTWSRRRILALGAASVLIGSLIFGVLVPAAADQITVEGFDLRYAQCVGDVPGYGVVWVAPNRAIRDTDILAISNIDIFLGPDRNTTYWEARLFGDYYDPPPIGEDHGEATLPLDELVLGVPELGLVHVSFDYSVGDILERSHDVWGAVGGNSSSRKVVVDGIARELLFNNATLRIDDGPVVDLNCTGAQSQTTYRSTEPTAFVAHSNLLVPTGECIATNSTYFNVTELSARYPVSSFVGVYADHPEVAVAPAPFALTGLHWEGRAALWTDGVPTGEQVSARVDIGDPQRPVLSELSGPGFTELITLRGMTLTASVGGRSDPIHATCPVAQYHSRSQIDLGESG